ncbi:glutaredoxin family protein [Simplicispira lacusdiani]|uniref:glutaredoxin family protein n=1 Tax=Simplicispira lacusdiani TaxID=2213010 RepID=UPI000E73CD68|nr:glutaredoxin family protein [Simplicispira lacusdiani]
MKLPHPTPALLALLCSLAVNGLAQAQQVHRIVGPDGKVTFSDRAPSLDSAAQPPSGGSATGSSGSANDALPYDLRQIANRFPVTLYTGTDCAPCASARNLLVNRGVPFTERTIGSNEDIDALKRLSGNTGLPFGTIGQQQLHGYSDSEWTQYLDAAGYPKQSKLPGNYRRPAATPLTPPKPATPAAATEETPATTRATPRARPAPEPNPGGPTPSNPAGIRF